MGAWFARLRTQVIRQNKCVHTNVNAARGSACATWVPESKLRWKEWRRSESLLTAKNTSGECGESVPHCLRPRKSSRTESRLSSFARRCMRCLPTITTTMGMSRSGFRQRPVFQAMLINSWPNKFFRPPYVGVRGWIGIELASLDDEELASHLRDAWSLVAPKKLRSPVSNRGGE